MRRENDLKSQTLADGILGAGFDDALPRAVRESQRFKMICIQCGAEITGQPYAFGGQVACEECVRRYYEGTPKSFSNRARESEWIVREMEKYHRRSLRRSF
jgi:hypothetical protein